jgi:AbrB family looped-hinge helix DNA binding protein
MNIVRVNRKNQVNIPKEVAESVNFGPERYVQVIADPDNVIRLIPFTPEPLYSKQALEGLDHLVEREKDKAEEIRGPEQVRKIFKRL